MPPVPLTREQLALKRELASLVRDMRELVRSAPDDPDRKWPRLMKRAGDVAHDLHLSLKSSGHDPRHHDYMLENRGVPADSREFYAHFHPIEDLLKYLRNPDANNDPLDLTLGATFLLRVFSWRWGHHDTYQLTRTPTGWRVRSFEEGDCEKDGQPLLYRLLAHDRIDYPHSLPDWLSSLWEKAAAEGLSESQVQNAMTALGKWISNTEQSAPCEGVWNGFKRTKPRRRRRTKELPSAT